MKTTIELPDALARQLKARAALKGQTIKAFITDAVRDKLSKDSTDRRERRGWRTVFGKAPKGSTEEVQAIIEAEFSRSIRTRRASMPMFAGN